MHVFIGLFLGGSRITVLEIANVIIIRSVASSLTDECTSRR
jgi:hypothetical protein